MKTFVFVLLVLFILGLLGTPWRFGVYPLYKGLSSLALWMLNVLIFLLMVGFAIWAARLIVNWLGL